MCLRTPTNLSLVSRTASAIGSLLRSGPSSDRVPPPIGDLHEQQAVIDRVRTREWPFVIKLLEPSLLGPVALIDGDYEAVLAAEPILAEALGWKLDEAEPLVSRVVRRAPGYVDMWVWPAAGSFQLF